MDKESVFANYKSVFSRQFAVSLAVEFLGVMFFQILGGATENGRVAAVVVAGDVAMLSATPAVALVVALYFKI